MKTLEYNSKRLARRIRVLMKESSKVAVSANAPKNELQMQGYNLLTEEIEKEVSGCIS